MRTYRIKRGSRARLAAGLALVALAWAQPARAQCGAKRSTCSGCHDGARAAYAAGAPWHADHAFADVCAVCHGGAPDAPAPADAHVGLVAPLTADAAQCSSCHGASSAALAARYTPRAGGAVDAGAIASAPSSAPPSDARSNDGAAAVLAALVGLLGLGWILVGERQALRRWRSSWIGSRP